MKKATLQTAAFCEHMRFTKGQAINFEILMLVDQKGMGARAAMRQVCGPMTDTLLPADTTDADLLKAIKDTFFEAITDEQVALAFAPVAG